MDVNHVETRRHPASVILAWYRLSDKDEEGYASLSSLVEYLKEQCGIEGRAFLKRISSEGWHAAYGWHLKFHPRKPNRVKMNSQRAGGTQPAQPHQPPKIQHKCPEHGKPEAEFERLVYVCYRDHVLYHRAQPEWLSPQTREAVGWLVHACADYIILCWDRKAEPPTLKGGDPKASGLVLLRSDILELKRLG